MPNPTCIDCDLPSDTQAPEPRCRMHAALFWQGVLQFASLQRQLNSLHLPLDARKVQVSSLRIADLRGI